MHPSVRGPAGTAPSARACKRRVSSGETPGQSEEPESTPESTTLSSNLRGNVARRSVADAEIRFGAKKLSRKRYRILRADNMFANVWSLVNLDCGPIQNSLALAAL